MHDPDNSFFGSTRFNYLLNACLVFYAIFLIPRPEQITSICHCLFNTAKRS